MDDSYWELPERHITAWQLVACNMAPLRRAAGIGQAELGERIGWTGKAVSHAERSWAGERVRHFNAGVMLDIALALGVPLPALLLPPEDDGQGFRYVVDYPDAGAREISMPVLMTYVMSEPADDGGPAMDRYRLRYTAAIAAYLDPERIHELTGDPADLATEDAALAARARVRRQRQAFRDTIALLEEQDDRLGDRLAEIRAAR